MLPLSAIQKEAGFDDIQLKKDRWLHHVLLAKSMKFTSPPLMGKTGLVTGSTEGLGLAIAEGLARAGCNIVLHGLASTADMLALQHELEQKYGVRVGYAYADLTDPAAIVAMIEGINGKHGCIDVLVNNAVTRHFSPDRKSVV